MKPYKESPSVTGNTTHVHTEKSCWAKWQKAGLPAALVGRLGASFPFCRPRKRRFWVISFLRIEASCTCAHKRRWVHYIMHARGASPSSQEGVSETSNTGKGQNSDIAWHLPLADITVMFFAAQLTPNGTQGEHDRTLYAGNCS